MKFQDSLIQANNKLATVLSHLENWHLPPTPVNYVVLYAFVSARNLALNEAINARVKSPFPLDNFFMEEVFIEHISSEHTVKEQLVEGVGVLLNGIEQQFDSSDASVSRYLDTLDKGIPYLDSNNVEHQKRVAQALLKASKAVLTDQQKLKMQLQRSRQEAEALKEELQQAKREAFTDSLTGLHNRKAMKKYMDEWLEEDANREINAIAIDIDHFKRFNDTFGHIIGDVILGKVANKIRSYVNESGIAVRYGGEEFLVLLPDLDIKSTVEIAEKIRQGVEKMRFVSAKSKQRLPQVTVSVGVSSRTRQEQWQKIVKRADNALYSAKRSGRNQVKLAAA